VDEHNSLIRKDFNKKHTATPNKLCVWTLYMFVVCSCTCMTQVQALGYYFGLHWVGPALLWGTRATLISVFDMAETHFQDVRVSYSLLKMCPDLSIVSFMVVSLMRKKCIKEVVTHSIKEIVAGLSRQ
jgi:hypothetical protein